MAFTRPNPPQKPSKSQANPNPAAQPVKSQKKVIPAPARGGDGNNNGGNRGGGGNNGRGNNPEPSPWLMGRPPEKIDPAASFVEYLRWMRSRDQDAHYKDATKNLILQMSVEGRDYSRLLQQRNDRIKKIAQARGGESFSVMCPWRVRVGGHRGPESILLPAFDSLGIPYIPSSTLTGVARTAAIRELMETKRMSWKDAEKAIAPYFGFIETTDNKNKAGKVIFLDAYPEVSQSAGVTMDMANSIWRWENNNQLGSYSPNPNSFLSLKETKFLVGICRMSSCDEETFAQVKKWLIQGLQDGIGSQVNSGYGFMQVKDSTSLPPGFFELDFEVWGQLVHCVRHLKLDEPFKKDKPNYDSAAGNGEELRSVAIRNLMRYWFRVFAFGVLPNHIVRETEGRIFGAINPKNRGYLCVYVFEDKNGHQPAPELNQNGERKTYGKQKGKLILARSSEPIPKDIKDIKDKSAFEDSVRILSTELVWITFHLGGVGQGARRPLYSRNGRKNGKPPWWRGSTIVPKYTDSFPKPLDFAKEFSAHLEKFYTALGVIASTSPLSPLKVVNPSASIWAEAADQHCQIWLVPNSSPSQSAKPDPTARPPKPGKTVSSFRTVSGVKPSSLVELHNLFHPLFDKYKVQKNSSKDNEKREAYRALTEAKNLCGHTEKDTFPSGEKREATPSPIWIANHETYQVVTVFGAMQEPRKGFVEKLKRAGAIQIFPIA